MRILTFMLTILISVMSGVAWAQATPDFNGLEAIEGSWKLVKATTEHEQRFRLRYHFIARNSALVEVYGDPAKQTTETVFHRDGKALLATHYCARGNQPRLKASEKNDTHSLQFNFIDITNLNDKKEPHMVRMKFRFIDKDHFEKEETYLVDGREQTSLMSLQRIN
jgi:uncharacterized protein YkuJ